MRLADPNTIDARECNQARWSLISEEARSLALSKRGRYLFIEPS
jgi:hypothetical protein